MRHEEINDDREDNNVEHGVTTQGRNVSGHLLHPRRPDRIRKVISAAKKEKDPYIELGRVALQHLLSNVAECKHQARDRKDRCQRPDLRSVKAHLPYCFAQIPMKWENGTRLHKGSSTQPQ